jgi:hypothetical protein
MCRYRPTRASPNIGSGTAEPTRPANKRRADRSTVGPVDADTIPHPGDVSPGFIAEAGRCWRMVYDHNLQATHRETRPAGRVGGAH